MITKRTRGHVLVAMGLLGIAAYEVVLRTANPALLRHDLVHGLWLGVCIGVEILGVMTWPRGRGQRTA